MQKLKKPENILILVVTLFRLFLSQLLSIWYPSDQMYDDSLLIKYAGLVDHFKDPDALSLVKDMSYPIFIDFVHITGLSYSMVLSIIWIVAAILTVKMLKNITENKFLLIFTYLFILFTPSAFDVFIGTRLYRNSIIVPFVLITFVLMLDIVLNLITKSKICSINVICNSVFLGFVFSFTYYIKEDGIWLLPCLVLTVLISVAIVSYRYVKFNKINEINQSKTRVIMLVVTICLPILIFTLNTNIYKLINYHYFGVYEINTRTEGEVGKFVNNVYKIKSDDRTVEIWAPYDAIDKAFKSSKTLGNYPELKDKIIHTPWFGGDINKEPIYGDFLTWVLRSALVDSNVWQSERQVSDLFRQVNIELEDAFNNGTLQKDNKFQISASSGGRSLKEILQLKNLVVQQYKCALKLDGYYPGGNFGSYQHLGFCEAATILTNMNHMPFEHDIINNYKLKQFSYGNNIASDVFKIYSFINPILFILSVVSILIVCFKIFRKKYENKASKRVVHVSVTLIMFILLGISFMYAIGIAWFSEFLSSYNSISFVELLKFYSVGLVPLVYLFEIFGIYLLIDNIKIKQHNNISDETA